MTEWLTQRMAEASASTWAVVGALVTAVICAVLTRPALVTCEAPVRRWPLIMTIVGLGLGAALAYCMDELQCQRTPEVIPSQAWQDLRIVYHAICLGLLLVITATDLASLYIPNFVVNWGLAIAVVGAFVSGELQMAHLWVDWNEEIPGLRGPYIPDWIQAHQHWHALAWSLIGAIVGWVLIEVVRRIAEFALGRPAMGAGDVTLMAMIGAFLGWQATVIAFFIAPILALVLGPLARRISKEVAVPYGPFLAMGAIITMFAWRWIWMFEIDISSTGPGSMDDRSTAFAVRRMFGDWMLLTGLSGVALVGTVGLMILIRLFWSLPIQRVAGGPDLEIRNQSADESPAPPSAPPPPVETKPPVES